MKLSKEQQQSIMNTLTGNKNLAPTESVTLDEIQAMGDKKSLSQMVIDIQKYNRMLNERLIFINESLTAAIPFTRENLYLMCAFTGNGKSTAAANITYPLLKQKKKILVISNEEPAHDILLRIACLELGFNFNDYKKGMMPKEQQLLAIGLFEEIGKYVHVIDVSFKNGFTSKVECVKNAMEQAKTADYACILIDYFQNIKQSANDTTRKAYDVLNDFRSFLNVYIKSSNAPVVLFVQLYSQSKRQAKGHDIDTRIKECSAIVEPATVIIEMIPNFEESNTEFIIHKDRFGRTGTRLICPFERGRYLKQLTPEQMAQARIDEVAGKAEGALKQ